MSLMDVVEPEILRSKYPAKEHARKVARYIIEHGGKKNGVIYLEAQKLRYNEDNDQEACFR
jgi:Xaa-Pro dipeptidase